MNIFISYYAKKSDRKKVSISLYPPKWFEGPCVKILAPNEETFNTKDREEYIRLYKAQLDEIPTRKFHRILARVTDDYTTDIELCCYESLKEPDEFCHRTILAEYLNERIGSNIITVDPHEGVAEVAPTKLEPDPYFKPTEQYILDNDDIYLDEPTHIYHHKVHTDVKFTSCTTIVKDYWNPFDSRGVATKLTKFVKKYRHYSVDELLDVWKKKGEFGTKVHLEMEDYIIKGDEPETSFAKHGRAWLDKAYPKDKFKLMPEIIVYDLDLQISGMIDLLVIHIETGIGMLVDWKTNTNISRKGFNNLKGPHPLTQHMPDCNHMHYTCQLSLYRKLLETRYGMRIDAQALVWLREGHCELIPTVYKESFIESIFDLRAKQLEEESRA